MNVQWENPIGAPCVKWDTPTKKQRTLGQPYQSEYWTYRVYEKFGGQVIYTEEAGWMSHSAGIAKLLALGTSYGSTRTVCGTYKFTYNFYTPGATLCSHDGGLTYTAGSPSFPPAPAPFPFIPLFPTPVVPRSRFAPFFGQFAAPFNPLFPGYVRRVTWTTPAPIAVPLFARPYTVRWTVSGKGDGRVGDPCSDLNAAVTNTKNARAGLAQTLAAVNTAYNNAVAANDQAAIADLYASKQGLQADLAETDAKIVALEAQAKAACAPAPSQPQCVNDHPDCGAAGFICVNGQCVPGCKTDADCGPGFVCVNGFCEKEKPTSSGEGTPWGLFALGAAALGAIFVGLKPPKLPRSESGRALQLNPRRRRRRRRRGY